MTILSRLRTKQISVWLVIKKKLFIIIQSLSSSKGNWLIFTGFVTRIYIYISKYISLTIKMSQFSRIATTIVNVSILRQKSDSSTCEILLRNNIQYYIIDIIL